MLWMWRRVIFALSKAGHYIIFHCRHFKQHIECASTCGKSHDQRLIHMIITHIILLTISITKGLCCPLSYVCYFVSPLLHLRFIWSLAWISCEVCPSQLETLKLFWMPNFEQIATEAIWESGSPEILFFIGIWFFYCFFVLEVVCSILPIYLSNIISLSYDW